MQSHSHPRHCMCESCKHALYFRSYSSITIHEEMIKDQVRTKAYYDAIMANRDYIKDKVVLDVGCGTGILSIFAAQAGAKRVYAIEASDISGLAESIAKENGFAETIKVLKGKVEEVNIDEKADVLLSEWMGYSLIYENMLESVIVARNRFLNPGGLILPRFAEMMVAPFADAENVDEHLSFWNSVYGVKMTSLIPFARKSVFAAPVVEALFPECVLASSQSLVRLDLATIPLSSPFSSSPSDSDSQASYARSSQHKGENVC
eukprot:GCRY01006210.1.p1 GENE.GCRY01006210.1~~GCRY01006210.1.p1  ORF type:complete len:262 (-),score=37.21 GCRY01006210.1:164-949(-)